MPPKIRKSDNGGGNPPDHKQGGWESTAIGVATVGGAAVAVVGGVVASPVMLVGGGAFALVGGVTYILKK